MIYFSERDLGDEVSDEGNLSGGRFHLTAEPPENPVVVVSTLDGPIIWREEAANACG